MDDKLFLCAIWFSGVTLGMFLGGYMMKRKYVFRKKEKRKKA